MTSTRSSRAFGVCALLALAWSAGCGRGDAGGGDDGGSPFGDTGGLIAMDPTGGDSAGASSGGTGGASTSGGGGASTSGGTTASGASGTGSAGSGGSSSGGGASGGSTGGGTSNGGGSSSGGGTGDCSSSVMCGGAFPYCDLNRSPPACVAGATDTLGELCTSDADCNFGEGGTGVVCDLFFTCAPGCWSDGDCPSDQPFCDTNSFFPACVASPSDTLGEACFQDSDCNFGLPQAQVVCTFFGCAVGCHFDSDCSTTECCDNFWDPGVCVSC